MNMHIFMNTFGKWSLGCDLHSLQVITDSVWVREWMDWNFDVNFSVWMTWQACKRLCISHFVAWKWFLLLLQVFCNYVPETSGTLSYHWRLYCGRSTEVSSRLWHCTYHIADFLKLCYKQLFLRNVAVHCNIITGHVSLINKNKKVFTCCEILFLAIIFWSCLLVVTPVRKRWMWSMEWFFNQAHDQISVFHKANPGRWGMKAYILDQFCCKDLSVFYNTAVRRQNGTIIFESPEKMWQNVFTTILFSCICCISNCIFLMIPLVTHLIHVDADCFVLAQQCFDRNCTVWRTRSSATCVHVAWSSFWYTCVILIFVAHCRTKCIVWGSLAISRFVLCAVRKVICEVMQYLHVDICGYHSLSDRCPACTVNQSLFLWKIKSTLLRYVIEAATVQMICGASSQFLWMIERVSRV